MASDSMNCYEILWMLVVKSCGNLTGLQKPMFRIVLKTHGGGPLPLPVAVL